MTTDVYGWNFVFNFDINEKTLKINNDVKEFEL